MADRIEIFLRGLKRRSVAAQNASAKVPFMITNQQKQLLRELGHDDDAISKMTPEQAHKALVCSADMREAAN